MYERRSNRRFGVQERVDLDIRRGRFLDVSQQSVRASVEDIGRGGMRVVTDRMIDADSRVLFAMSSSFLPEPLQGGGRICYVRAIERAGVRAFAVGVAFTRVRPTAVCRFLGKINGWRRSARLSRGIRSEMSLLSKVAPFLLITAWFLAQAFVSIDRGRITDEAYTKRLKEAVIYALYHMD